MKKSYIKMLCFASFLYSGEIFSQSIGINTTGAAADGSALLEVGKGTAGTPDTKGVLIPRVNLSATNNNAPIGSWVNGLLVFNLANAGAFSTNVVANTFYYCDGTQWLRLNGSLNGDWTLTGNALSGTLPGTPNEWIGTTNAADFVIKTATVTQMRIRSTGTIYMINDVAIADNTVPNERLRVLDGSGDRTTVGIVNNVLTTGTALNVSSTSTGPGGAISQTDKLINLSRTGANAFASHTSYGIFSSIANTGTTNTNIGGYFSASGASTGNYGIIVPSGGGNVGIGISAPAGTLSIVSPNTNGATSSSALNLTAASLINGTAFDIAATVNSTALNQDVRVINSVLNNIPTGNKNIFRGNLMTINDNTTLASTITGSYTYIPLTGNAAKIALGVYGQVSSTSTTADVLTGVEGDVSSTGAISVGTRDVLGTYGVVSSTAVNTGGITNLLGVQGVAGSSGASTAGTTNLYGLKGMNNISAINGSTVNSYGVYAGGTTGTWTAGTINQYGVYIANPPSSTNGTSTKYGLYVASQTGADANYAAAFLGGNVGIGLAAPLEQLHITQNFRFPATTAAAGVPTAGAILQGVNRFIHTYTTGNPNTFVGVGAGNFSTTGTGYNVGVGYNALTALTTGRQNTAVGGLALPANLDGINNTAIGVVTLQANTSGSWNTAVGANALNANTSGQENTSIGEQSMTSNTTGSYNVAVGERALRFTATAALSGNNTGVGWYAGAANTTGTLNTCIGSSADVGAVGLTIATALGSGAVVNASNKVRIGSAAVTVVEGAAVYTVSDGRFKKNISEEVMGLDFINRLRPVVYNFDTKQFDEFLIKNMPDSVRKFRVDQTDYRKSTAIRQSGFIAQEVEKAVKESGYDFNGLHKPDNENDNYSIAYGQFVVPIVKSVQELSAQNEAQQKTIELLLKRIEALESSKNTPK